jgi:hypothetical protein
MTMKQRPPLGNPLMRFHRLTNNVALTARPYTDAE